jgi:two-component system sensor histidine kinase HydH
MATPNITLDEVEREILRRLFAHMVRVRLVVAPLVFVALLLGLMLADSASWRLLLLTAVAGIASVRVVLEYRFYQRTGFAESRIPLLMVWIVPLASSAILVTGGISSPVMPLLLPAAFFLNLFLAPRGGAAVLAGISAVLWLLVWLAVAGPIAELVPAELGGGRAAGRAPALVYWQGVVYQFALVVVTTISQLMRRAYREMVMRALAGRDEVLRLHGEGVRALTTLSAEIAHELKNPLASVKGLAALVDREVTGKPQERMAVLRQEVDRMQEILETFLNFSRPLVPLDARPVRLRALCEEVVALHEGMALERGVSLRVLEEASVEVRADPRKLKQIAINLVQNALEASPRGGAVELIVRVDRLVVRDHGPGVAVGERLFEPGVTTKAQGSGLGLTIARALARQHGGELTLEPAQGGGCAATLVLPPR